MGLRSNNMLKRPSSASLAVVAATLLLLMYSCLLAPATARLIIPSTVELSSVLDVSLNNYMPNQAVQDTNRNWLFVSGVNATVVSLPSLMTRGVNDPLTGSLIFNPTAADMTATPDIREAIKLLGGLLTGTDYTKAVMPAAHTITWLVWGAHTFPSGYTSQQMNQLVSVVKQGADLLMRSNLNVNDPFNPIFVAQLGDPATYTVISDPGYDPVKQDKSWTSPSQDPQLSGSQPRKAWLLTRETVGADVLAGAAAALAAASILVRTSDPTWAANALYHARYLQDFAMSGPNDAQSYCQFVPCTGSVTVSSQVRALPVTENASPNGRRLQGEGLTQKDQAAAAAAVVTATNVPGSEPVINGTDTKVCYLPNLVNATCDEASGAACQSYGIITTYEQPVACCNALATMLKSTSLTIVDNKTQLVSVTLTGICSAYSSTLKPPPAMAPPAPVAPNVTDGKPVCYWVDWVSSTCRFEVSQQACDARKRVVNEVFTTKSACCSYLSSLNVWSQTYTKAQGICALPDNQWQCYVPDLSQRTCYAQNINQTTGEGCAGKGLEVFATSLSCCSWLSNQASGASGGSQSLTGMCTGTSNNTKVCYLPDLVNATCDESNGAACQAYGIITSYDTAVGCCNALATMLKSTSLDKQTQLVSVTLFGICAPHIPTLVPPPAPVVTPNVRKLQGRGLMQTNAAAAAVAATVATQMGDSGNSNTPISQQSKFFEDPCAKPGACTIMQIDQTVNVTYFNSTTVMDDLAWGSIWLYKATNESHYLGIAQHLLNLHYQKELPEDIMSTSREIYVSDWNYQGWAANLMLAEITDAAKYHDRLHSLLNVWITGDAVPSVRQPVSVPPADVLMNGRQYKTFTVTDPATGKNTTYAIIPECTPTKTSEQNCFDGKDDDCNGLVDREDPACGLFPVLYTPKNVAFSKAPSLPNAANTAFLALAYAQLANGETPNKLRCWALAQIGHMLGSGADERSFVVGVGKNPPTMIQHRASSCPLPPGVTTWDPSVNDTNAPPCDWSSGFYPATPNPRLNMIAGALIGGPDRFDNLMESRRSDQMRVTMHDNAGFLSAIAGLVASNTNPRTCESQSGLLQRYAVSQKYV